MIAAGRVSEVATLFLTRAERLSDPAARVALRKRAAKVQQEHLHDVVSARTSYVMALRDAQDPEALLWLANDAEERKDVDGAVAYLSRLVDAETETSSRVEYALREARLHARGLNDIESGVQRLHFILSELDETNEAAMTEIADLEQSRGRHDEAAKILERQFASAKNDETRLEVAARLAELYERRLDQPNEAIRVLSFVHDADPGDFDATQRLCHLAEENGKWELVAELVQELVAVEGDAEEASRMTRRLAAVFADKLERGDEGLRVLAEAGDRGDAASRDAFVELGDRLNKPAEVARYLVAWHKQDPASDGRTEALTAAFSRFVESNSDAEAIEVAKELGASDAASPSIGETLEPIAVRAKDLEALQLAHSLRVDVLEGDERATEFVRQAEVLALAEVPSDEVVRHGETGLKGVDPAEVEPLLTRLSALAPDVNAKIAVYERQIARCTTPETALPALCRAAEVALELGDTEQSGGFFQMALAENLPEESLERLHELVRAADKRRPPEVASLREVFAEALARGGQGARDGGKARSRMLRRAAKLAAFELRDTTRALTWIGDALSQYVEAESLATLNDVAAAVGDYQVAEQVATRALGEVFDGPMVRELLRYRADLRQDQLDNLAGAAEDLRRLHDLNPADFEVNGRLATMYEELGDYLGMVRLYEDQILRSRDQTLRGELARTVARLWQDKLDDPRETADAWRRVLRFNSGDEEAKQGLAKAKASMLHARPGDSSALPPPVVDAPPPPMVGVSPIPSASVVPSTTDAAVVPPLPPLLPPEPAAESPDDSIMPAAKDFERAVESTPPPSPSEEPATATTVDVEGEDVGETVGETIGEGAFEAEQAPEANAPAATPTEDVLTPVVEEEATEEQSFTDADVEAPWSNDEVAVSRSPQPDPFDSESDEDLDEAELIEEVDEVEEEGEQRVSAPPRSVTAPPSRRAASEAGDLPKPPPTPSIVSRKE